MQPPSWQPMIGMPFFHLNEIDKNKRDWGNHHTDTMTMNNFVPKSRWFFPIRVHSFRIKAYRINSNFFFFHSEVIARTNLHVINSMARKTDDKTKRRAKKKTQTNWNERNRNRTKHNDWLNIEVRNQRRRQQQPPKM